MKVPGVKLEKESARGSLGWMRLTGENVLLEVCFISNKEEMENYQNKKHYLAKVIAYTLFKHSMLP
jgi:N-acetylmuramoyl-L-alanine amidase